MTEPKDKPPSPDFAEVFSSPDGQDLIADGYLPDPDHANAAAVVFVHGGGWRVGSRHAFRWHAHQLSLHGYVACTIDYRLAPANPYPAALIDCQSALKWVRKQTERFQIRQDRIGVVGSSAGGHLVACLGVRDDPEDTISAQADCVVDVHGIHDFPIIGKSGVGPVMQSVAFLGSAYPENSEIWEDASPALHVSTDTAPMLLIHDPDDEVVPCDQSLLMGNALMRAGRPMQFLPTPGSGHGFVYDPEHAWTRRVWPTMVTWLNQHLPGPHGQS